MKEFGPSRRREGLEALAEGLLHLLEGHGWTVVREADAAPTSPRPGRILKSVTRRKLLRRVDLAEIVGVSRQRANVLSQRPDFPKPVDHDVRGDLWAASDNRAWARTYPFGSRRWGARSRR